MERKIELKTVAVKGTQPTRKQILYIDGKEVWAAEYWPDSEASCEAHSRIQAAAFDRFGITQDEAFQLEIDEWNNG